MTERDETAAQAKPAPVPDELSAPYWDGAREGRLMLQRCVACGEHQFYPRPLCLACHGSDLEWVEASGRARLHTFSVVHRTADRAFAADVPYAFAIAELHEGPRVTVNVVDTPLETLRPDMPVRVVFTPVGDAVLPNVRGEA